jgi:flagellar motor switch protein FliG
MTKLTPIGKLPPPAVAAGASAGLTRRQKAAIVVRYLTAEGADVPLRDLPEEMQAALAQTIGAMRYVDRKTLAGVIAEFAQELESVGLAFPKGLAGALRALDGKISPLTAARLRREAGVRQSGDPWARLTALEVDALLPFFAGERVEICAVLLSKLDVRKAAEVLGRLDGALARRITYAVSQTDKVTPDAVYRIGLSLATQLDDVPERAFDDGPDRRVGEILNHSPALTRDEVLEGLDQTDEAFAAAVRRAIFTFANIADSIAPRDVPGLARGIDQPVLVTALAHAGAAGGDLQRGAEFLLANLSGRLADAIREEIADTGRVKRRAGEAACAEVVSAIRQMVDAGELTLRLPGDEEEEEAP